MVRVGILGATGYTALELMKLLLRHPDVEIATLTSRQEGNPHVSAIHPQLTGRLDLQLEDIAPETVAAKTDCVFSCLPHATSAAMIMKMLGSDVRVIDFSADYRLRDANSYAEWYGHKHPDPDRLGNTVYGLPELFSDDIPGEQLVANPGCYTSTSILGLAPLLAGNYIEPAGIIIDAKSGVSGAGRSPKLTTLYPECNESLSAYAVGRHRHTPEIEQVLSLATKQDVQVIFTPHLVPMDRGILCTIYATPVKDASEDQLMEAARTFYEDKPFVRVVEHLPATKDVTGTNFCDISIRVTRGRVIILSCTDNLIKGASGVAVQNFNLMHGFDETTALL
ncbi:MAG: N-acetyl-gamma-glutamyl-phosphate reductase [Planctomycetaceae bacterium]|nr:N-acetyl-gamma-glutamyl-phosphate reductase [Planctomycetaceae bacterium]